MCVLDNCLTDYLMYDLCIICSGTIFKLNVSSAEGKKIENLAEQKNVNKHTHIINHILQPVEGNKGNLCGKQLLTIN